MPLAQLDSTKSEGIISPNVAYRLDEALARLDWSAHAWRSAKSHGLKPIRLHGRVYLRGNDVLAYIDKRAAEQQAGPAADRGCDADEAN